MLKTITSREADKYPSKFSVFTNVEWSADNQNRLVGFFYDVFDNHDDALNCRDNLELESKNGRVEICEGTVIESQIGGLYETSD